MHIMTVAEWVPIMSLVASCLGIPTLAALIMTDIYKRRKENSENEKRKRHEELMEGVRTVVREENKEIREDIAALKADSDLTKQSLQATLRHDLHKTADKWLTKGYCPISDKEDFDNIYNKYHSLGKNGVMDDIYEKVMELPVTKPTTTRKRTSYGRNVQSH